MPNLPQAMCTGASFFYGGYLYVGGGIGGLNDTQLDNVYRSPIGADHSLGAWEVAPALGIKRGHVHQFPIFQNHVYSVAGAITEGPEVDRRDRHRHVSVTKKMRA